MTQTDPRDIELMELAFSVAGNCTPVESAFNVGAVLASPMRTVLATGFSRETGPHEHAEEAAFMKAQAQGVLVEGCWLYVSLEPCGIRKSKARSCSELAVAHRVARIFYGSHEPPFFVKQQSGLERMKTGGLDVIYIPGFEERFERMHPHLFGRRDG